MYGKNDSRSSHVAEGEGVGGLEEAQKGRTCLGEMDVEVTCDSGGCAVLYNGTCNLLLYILSRRKAITNLIISWQRPYHLMSFIQSITQHLVERTV